MSFSADVMRSKEHFSKTINLYGDSPEGVQWSSRETQERRFEILLEISDIKGTTILDFGCSTGALLDYIKKKKIPVKNYIGVDLVEDALNIAKRKHCNANAMFMSPESFFDSDITVDYGMISGVFNLLLDDNVLYYKKILKRVYDKTIRGLSFNMLSSYVDYYDEGLFYEKPEKVFAFVKEQLSDYVVLRNEYQIKLGVRPFEFTIYVYR